MPSIIRGPGDPLSGGDITNEHSSNVFAGGDDKGCVRGTLDKTAGIGHPDTSPTTFIPPPTPNVFINNLPAVAVGDSTILGESAVTGAPTVAVNSQTGAGAVIDNNAPVKTDGTVVGASTTSIQPTIDPTYLAANTGSNGRPLVTAAEGSYYEKDDQESSAALPTGSAAVQKQETQQDVTPPPSTGTPVHSCPDINSLSDSFNWINEPPTAAWLASSYATSHMLTAYDDSFNAFQDWSQSFQLSTTYTIYDVTMGTKISRYKFTSSVNQNGSDNLTQKATMVNLCYHANVVLEVLKAAYPDMVITSAFRSLGGSSQHNKGQASDVQFLSLHGHPNTAQLYYNRAKEIRDNFNFDQLILEWFGKNPWIHISSNPASHRHQILTQVAPNSYQTGLVLLS